jgi:protein-tyrosine phosphatase
MDYGNLRSMRRICGDDPAGKMHLLLDYTDHPRDIADPWYTDDFNTAWKDIEVGCRSLLEKLQQKM